MGLFSKLADTLKSTATELKNDETLKNLGKAAEEMAGKVSQMVAEGKPAAQSRPVQPTPPQAEKSNAYDLTDEAFTSHDTGEEYFETIVLPGKFPGYTIEKNVHPRVMDSGAHPSCIPIAYLFSRGGKPVLAVLLMKPNQTRAMIARGTYSILDANHIPYIRFFKGYPNEEAYVIDRIKKNLP